MRSLYPDIKPFDRQMLEVGDGHQLYVDQSGRPGHHPVVFLHGGPGNGCEFDSRRFFDPDRYHIILFDQRVQAARYRQVRFTPIRWIISSTIWK